MTLLLILLTLGLGASSQEPPGVTELVAALEALLSSGSGSLPHSALQSLVDIAASRAQCHTGPCGKCISGGAILALAGKPGATAQLEATDLPWVGAAVLATLWDPPASCTDATLGLWAARTQALHRAFTATATATSTATAISTATSTGSGSGGPSLWEVAALLAAVQPNYRSNDSHEGCVDAAGVLAAGAAVSPRVGAGRVLAALGALVLHGRCLRPPPTPSFFLHRFGRGGLSPVGLSVPMSSHPGATPRPGAPSGHGDMDRDRDRHPMVLPLPHTQRQPQDTRYLPSPTLLQALGLPGAAALPRGQLPRLRPTQQQQQLACRPPCRRTPTAIRVATGTMAASPTATSRTATKLMATGPTVTSPTATNPTAMGQLSIAESYVLGSLAGLGLSLCPLLALALLRCPLCHRAQRCLRPLLLGLAAGALTGDALLHLLPQFLGLHTHGGGPGAHDGSPELPWTLVVVLGGLYAAFLLEKLLGILLPPRPEVKADENSLSQNPLELQNRGPQVLPCMVTLGDAAHSVADGLALGAALASSWRAGVATGLALLCHELPHALGDLAVLVQAGLSWQRALVLGLAGALPILPGIYIGLALGTATAARTWLGALATGLLLYLALCDMVPAMVAARDRQPWVLLALQSTGLLAGWGLLLLLALYEDSILR